MTFAKTIIVLSILASAQYLTKGDYARSLYWTGAAIIGIAILKIR